MVSVYIPSSVEIRHIFTARRCVVLAVCRRLSVRQTRVLYPDS